MPHLGPLPAHACRRLLVIAMLGIGCAHASATPTEVVSPEELAALRRDNATLRRHVADLDDRVVRLEHGSGNAASEGRDLPVVRLAPPGETGRKGRDRNGAAVQPRGRAGRTLGDLPNSAAPAEAWDDDDHSGLGDIDVGAGPGGVGGSYRLVGDRLVALTKAKAPTRPDRPARDAAGNAILTEYETAMALYEAGEVAGAERAFDIFAHAHPEHDYADNALYWKGEAAYDQQRFDDALGAFTEVVERYGGGNKAPDALLKIGLCYARLGDNANARDVLVGLVDAYPNARASDLARARLAEPPSAPRSAPEG